MVNGSAIRVVVADAHPLFVLGMKARLADEPGIAVVGEAANGDETLRVVEAARPDLLLLDVTIAGLPAFPLLNRLAALKLPTRTVLTSPDSEPGQECTAVARGARGVLPKQGGLELVGRCVRHVMDGEYWVSRESIAELIAALRAPAGDAEPGVRLSTRERDIVSALITGASNKDIAWQFGLGEQTIKNHLRRIFAKFGVGNRVELAVHPLARQLALAPGEPARSGRHEEGLSLAD